MRDVSIELSKEKITDFCRKWKIIELSLFGSALREDFRPDSDVDILVSFAEDAHWSLFQWGEMMEELQDMFGREVDLVEKEGLRNPFRRYAILTTRRLLYAS